MTDTSKREFEQSQKEAAAASSKVEEKTQIGERVGQVVIKVRIHLDINALFQSRASCEILFVPDVVSRLRFLVCGFGVQDHLPRRARHVLCDVQSMFDVMSETDT